jgi:lipoxygenase/linoleate 9S-lipoxygenase
MQALVNAELGPKQEKLFLSYLGDVIKVWVNMLTVSLLSSHADDETTLDEKNHYLLVRYVGLVAANICPRI